MYNYVGNTTLKYKDVKFDPFFPKRRLKLPIYFLF